MRLSRLMFAVAFGAGMLGLLSIVGCFDSLGDCELTGECVYGTLPCASNENTAPINKRCGVFVSSNSGKDNNPGTPSAPVQTLNKALELAKTSKTPVFACAETFPEAVTMFSGSVLYGGLDCSKDWQYVDETKKTKIAPQANADAMSQIALVLCGSTGTTRIENVVVEAPNATQLGGSSIAALAVGGSVGVCSVNSGTPDGGTPDGGSVDGGSLDGGTPDGGSVVLVRCELFAGNGMAGAKGAPHEPVKPGASGANGNAACHVDDVDKNNPGGEGAVSTQCDTAGGHGGAGTMSDGEKGAYGLPVLDPTWGEGGQGAGAGCKPGGIGLTGNNGASGAGATSSMEGTLSSTGFVGAEGTAGTDGTPGQGGGGGGGAKGKVGCNGASGGGGGAGGCGGLGGRGGQGGGASIALASVGASVKLKNVTLIAGTGGDGGDGGDGQNSPIGSSGGLGGAGSVMYTTFPACGGGKGGDGGYGGKGGGGHGGPSLGIAFIGPEPEIEDGSISIKLGTPGNGGAGADAAGTGADGTSSETLDLAKSN
jgi:hypothetical protein